MKKHEVIKISEEWEFLRLQVMDLKCYRPTPDALSIYPIWPEAHYGLSPEKAQYWELYMGSN